MVLRKRAMENAAVPERGGRRRARQNPGITISVRQLSRYAQVLGAAGHAAQSSPQSPLFNPPRAPRKNLIVLTFADESRDVLMSRGDFCGDVATVCGGDNELSGIIFTRVETYF